jgi:hypothetical protein
MNATPAKPHPIRRALDALLVGLVALGLSLGGGACLAQSERPIELHPGFVSDGPHTNPTPELPAVDVLEAGEDTEDAAHKDARRGLAPGGFQIRISRSVIRTTCGQQPDRLQSQQIARAFLARGPPTFA